LTPDERRDIQRLKLVEGESISEIARRTGRNRETVANVLRSEDTRELAQHLETESREAVLKVLRGSSEQAARDWRRASSTAADKGDHRPAKDLLLHTGVIQPLDSPVNVGVRVIGGSADQPAGPDPFEAINLTREGETR
jgi:transposase-like protein